jgi:TorA maturation chaperone TorD
MDADALARVAAQRGALYWLLAEFLLTHPDRSFVSRLRRELSAGRNDPASEPFAAQLSAVCEALPEPDDVAGIQALAVEHTRLFGGISPAYGPPPPYESVQRGAGVAGPAELAVAVASCYADAGLDPIDGAVPADHLGIELKFVALLCHREMEAWQRGRHGDAARALGLQRDFLDSHLLGWAPHYWRFVQARAEHVFLRRVAAFSLDAVSGDRVLIDELLADCAPA